MKSRSFLIQVLTCCLLTIEAQGSQPAGNTLSTPKKPSNIYCFAMLSPGFNPNLIDPEEKIHVEMQFFSGYEGIIARYKTDHSKKSSANK